jgi:hypothetical protein
MRTPALSRVPLQLPAVYHRIFTTFIFLPVFRHFLPANSLMGNPRTESTLPPVRDFGFGLCRLCAAILFCLHSLSEFLFANTMYRTICKWLTRTVWLKGCELLTWNVCSKIFLVIMHNTLYIHVHIITLSLGLVDNYFCGLFMYLWMMWCTIIKHSCLK